MSELMTRRSALAAPLLLAVPSRAAVGAVGFTALGQSLIEHDICSQHYAGFEAIRTLVNWGDVRFTNLEGPLGADDDKLDPDLVKHMSPVRVLDCLQTMGVNMLSLANNHAFDMGVTGMERTISAAKARGFAYAGTGANVGSASAPGYLATGSKAALVAFASKLNSKDGIASGTEPGANHLAMDWPGHLNAADAGRILQSIRDAAAKAEFVVAYHHDHYWEPDNRRTAEWKKIWARQCIDAGATVFVSHGAPVLQGIEVYWERPIFYDLGNFIFQTRREIGVYGPETWKGAIARCEFRGARLTRLTLYPVTLDERGEAGAFLETRGRPAPASRAEAGAILSSLDEMSRPLGTRLAIRGGVGSLEL